MGEKTSDQFLMAYGLSGTALDTGFLKGAAGFFLMLFPAAVFLFLFKKAYEKTSDQFLMAYGLSGTALDTGFLKGAAGFFLMLFPAAVFLFLFKKAYREAKKYKGKEAGFWIWRGACFILAAFVLGFLWNKIEIPKDWIPSVWSDFQFWQDKFKEAGENFRIFSSGRINLKRQEKISACFL